VTRTPPQYPKVLSDRAIAALTAGMAALGLVTLGVLFAVASTGPPEKRTELRMEAIKYGLGVAASGGALAALLLAVRRQRLAEHAHALAEQAQRHIEADAAERRVTELYAKSVEQLGSDSAAVRLGGLYALERVADNNPAQRQTVVDVLCAYLRMPYAVPDESVLHHLSRPVGPKRYERAPDDWKPSAPLQPEQWAARNELEVRVTAQRILAAHLSNRPAGALSGFWAGMDLDLTGATLIHFDLSHGHAATVCFDGAVFEGWARFSDAVFDGTVSFRDAVFRQQASFGKTRFGDEAYFYHARFCGGAAFSGTTFTGHVGFAMATFDRRAAFDDTRFATAGFGQAEFRANAEFNGATLAGDVTFAKTTFAVEPRLDQIRVVLYGSRRDVWPPGWQVVPDPGNPTLGRPARTT